MLETLQSLIQAHGDQIPLDRALLALASEEYPDLDADRYLAELDGWAAWVAAMDAPVRLAMRRVVFEMAGFKGDAVAYYAPENSLLNRVMDRRSGIPITLAVVYLEVARRLGEAVAGVGFPGHFLVKHDDVLIDPFDGGRVVTKKDCQQILARVVDREIEVEPWMLTTSPNRMILARVLVNLKNAYLLKRDLIMAARTIDRLLIVDPERITEIRDRGLIYAELGLAPAALVDLETYLSRSKAADRSVIEDLLPKIQAETAMMN